MGPKMEKVGNPDGKKWGLACDLTVEWILRDIEKAEKTKYSPKVENEILTDPSIPTESGKENIRNHCFALLDEQSRKLNMRGISAEQTYGWIKMGIFPYEDAVLEQCFAFDSHACWRKMGESGGAGAKKKWEDLLLGINGNSGGRGARGSSAGNEREEMDALKKGRYDYRRFLKRFAVMREEIELDMESFDYIPYDLGMRMFGNLPFVEPLEYKEVHKLEELVIAIDTSSSCSKETVQAFLNETYSILNEKENFFRRFKVVLIQCDCFLQSAVTLHNEEEWKDYIQHVVIEGRSGTDFRPVFRYVEELRQKRELRNLKALIYFTDGDGIYPTKAADYETAFVFLEKNDYMDMVPGWA
ncbi:MAG: hypothetical protein KBT01_01245, partial [Clostridiales bacterium]|nr:hypothetical protein [Candidatus Blautia equi]